ncbi:HlyD family type I secretion periplasmic adaptor subunit [Mesorhizobium sangaii]|uniref:Membrane fusion protein (MFP) family protein n=1 Tax=Mesorhizobium sangaii TaxID=505389 RepID=A0A841PM78_9HYPH|nr:HlyD family type I secretion periplasmic adaptor subunit [Mesorhizobium sangaii]MBB6411262.1 HlyD family secretion protein [Mesorhizobium sangaii]
MSLAPTQTADLTRSHAPTLPALQRSSMRGDGVRWTIGSGLVVVAALVGGIGIWAGTTSLAGAVIASGTVVVESNVKKVQEQTGGTVREILVRNGDKVTAGQVLVRFDDTVARANLGIIGQQLDRARLQMTRLEAETIGRDEMIIPDDLSARASDPAMAILIAGENALHRSNMTLLESQKAQLGTRNDQYREQIEGLKAQRDAALEALDLATNDLVIIQDLYAKRFASLDRLTALKTQTIQQKGEAGRLLAAIAEVEGRISENALASIQLDNDFRKSANADLREAEGKEAELVERKQVAMDQLDHMTIKAPQSGVVQELAIHTVGGVVASGETMMLIVPQTDDLVIDAQVPPLRIDDVSLGQAVVIRFSAFDRNTTPECHGTVDRISPDLVKDTANRTAYYEARINITDEAVCLKTATRLIPGMPAELHIQTGDRTVWSYLMKPITDQLSRAFRE